MEGGNISSSQHENSTFDETKEIQTRLNCINECICADNIDNVKTQMPVLSKISDHPKDFSELSKLISEEQVDIQEQLDKMDQDFAIDLNSVDKVKMPSEKIKFLDEQCLIIQNNKEELEKQLNEINKNKAESEPKNNLLQQKLIQINKLEESLNKNYCDIERNQKQMTNAQDEFLSEYSEMLHDRRKLSKECILQEIKLAKLSGGIESLEKIANRDHGLSQQQNLSTTLLRSSQTSQDNDIQLGIELDLSLDKYEKMQNTLKCNMDSLELNLNSIPKIQDTQALSNQIQSLEANNFVKTQIEDSEVLITRALQSMNKDIADLQFTTLRRGHYASEINEEYFSSTQYLASVQIKNLISTDSMMKLPEADDGTNVDKTKIVRKLSNSSDKSMYSRASSRCSSMSRKRSKITDKEIQDVIKVMDRKCEILRLNKENYCKLFANKEESIDDYNAYIQSDLTGFKKFCDDKIKSNIDSISDLDYNLKQEAIQLENGLGNLVNSLKGSTISSIKSKIIDISKQLDQMFKYIEKKISINDITTQRLLALNLMDKNIVSILMDRLLFCSQIFRYNQNLQDTYNDNLSLKLESLEDQISSTFEIAIAGCDSSKICKELRTKIYNLNANQGQISEKINSFSTSFSDFKTNFENLANNYDSLSKNISQFKKSKLLDVKSTSYEDLKKQIQSEIDIQKLKFEIEDQDYDHTFNKFQSLDNELKEMIYSINFDPEVLEGSNKNCTKFFSEDQPQLRNIDEIKKYSNALNGRIEDLEIETRQYDVMLQECLDLYKSLNIESQSSVTLKEKIEDLIDDYNLKIQVIETMKEMILNDIETTNKLIIKETQYKGVNIILRKNSITKEKVNAIVSPTNEKLDHTNGLSREIAEIGGQEIFDECRKYIFTYKKLGTGNAMITKAGSLPCEYIIHAVGPMYNKNLPENTLAVTQMKMVIESILKIIVDKNINSTSIPEISTDNFEFPISKAAAVFGTTIKNYIDANVKSFRGKTIVLCSCDDQVIEAFLQNAMPEFEQITEDSIPSKFLVENSFTEESKFLDMFKSEERQKIDVCSKCNQKIRNKTHQKGGKYLNKCYNCYIADKRKKIDDRDSDDQSDCDKSIKSRNKKLLSSITNNFSLDKKTKNKSPSIKLLGKSKK